ncbi:MAG TPA: DUF6165 family protein [Ignavibacteria bacterium]|nr:hypothetical protein [Bacteroidota bacterium]HRE10008.1 DUF6165 family protein [Ignavibacteria bacterium]HRF66925.1 DUF6165 family protein [Ignavibacteria bacterium]HRJ05704.1 DUF6165 family protein [Ignavibacteria bacterium]
MKFKIAVSPGELIDKITILEIKKTKVKEAAKLKLVKHELLQLTSALNKYGKTSAAAKAAIKRERAKLYNINLRLWNIEDKIRKKESLGKFDKEFIKLARSVYITNDKRSGVKNAINDLCGSEVKEVKQYSAY